MQGDIDEVVAIVRVSLLAVSNTATAFDYNITSLGTIEIGNSSRAFGINDSGQAVGGIRDEGGQ